MYRYKQWDWFGNQKSLFVIVKSINSYTEGIVNGILWNALSKHATLLPKKQTTLFFGVLCVFGYTTRFFSYCTNPISTSFFFTAATNSKGCKCISSQHNCGWHHTSNALWKELENSPYNIRKNQEVEKVLYMFYSMALYNYIYCIN